VLVAVLIFGGIWSTRLNAASACCLNVQNDSMKHAEIAAFFGRYAAAEQLYVDLDRK